MTVDGESRVAAGRRRWAPWQHSITTRTLLQMAVGVVLLIVAVTYVTYDLVFRAIEERTLINLNQYLEERTKRQEEDFADIEQHLRTARDAFIQRYREADPPGYLDRWDYYFEKCTDGGWRSKKEFSNDYVYAPLWGSKNLQPSEDIKRRALIMFDTCQKFLPGWVNNFGSLYGYTNDEQVVVGFDPSLKDWIYYQPSDYDVNQEEFGKLALREYNPSREVVWTGTTSNDGAGKALVSVIMPVDLNGRLVMTVGHDLQVDNLVEETKRGDVAGLTHVLFRQDGRMIAHPQMTKEIFKGNGKLTLQNSGDPMLQALYPIIAGNKERQFSGYDPRSGTYYAAHRMAGPEWIYLAAMPRSVLRDQAFHSTRWVLYSALILLGCELVILGIILRRSIARPINELVAATRRFAAGERDVTLEMNRQDELGVLAGAFNEMAATVRARDESLLEEKVTLEERVEQRTTELRETNESLRKSEQDLAAALARQTELVQLKSNFVSLVSHEFRTPLEVITSSAFNLERYHERLAPGERMEMLGSIREAVRRMAGMMEQVLLLGRMDAESAAFHLEPIDLPALCREIVAEVEAAVRDAGRIDFEVIGDVSAALLDAATLRHMLGNLLSNALKYSPSDSRVKFTILRDGDDMVFVVADRGRGIPDNDRKRLFEAFHRGGNVGQTPGTGLGLVIVQRCAELHGGRVACESREGQGTTFSIRLPAFAHTSQ